MLPFLERKKTLFNKKMRSKASDELHANVSLGKM